MYLSLQKAKVLKMVQSYHEGQLRKYNNEPYWCHLYRVAENIYRVAENIYHLEDNIEWLIVPALCHDIIEDTKCTEDMLLQELNNIFIGDMYEDFNKERTNIVKELTNQFTSEKYPNLNRKKRKELERERLADVSREAQTIKYADIIDNVSSIRTYDKKFAKIYIEEKRSLLKVMNSGNRELYKLAIKVCE